MTARQVFGIPVNDPEARPERCGSWRVTKYLEGYEQCIEWCASTSGPCPYPGTHPAATRPGDEATRLCRASRGT